MKNIIDEFSQTRRISRVQLGELQNAIARADKVARQSQQIARLGEGRLRQSHERLQLGALLEDAIHDRQDRIHRSGIELTRSIRPVEIIVDPGLLSSLLEAALDWALALGQRVSVSLSIKNWPENGQLIIKASQIVVSDAPADLSSQGDVMDWQLLVQLARAMGVSLQREFPPGEAQVTIEFSRTVKQLEGITTMELESGEDAGAPSSHLHSGTRPLAGHRLLLATADPLVRAEVQSAAALLGLVVDTVATARQAVRCVEIDRPHMLIVDERLRDEQIDNLILDLKRHNPNFGLLEVADDSNTFAIASWMSDTNTRVSRDLLRTQLPSLLTLELAKSF
ncbi:MAG: hypothetical protein EOP39_25350 [Rubrivivax sp.]|nr:MAG: hypothetical protein EOP39_25350 [Rubrivivax sp.]